MGTWLTTGQAAQRLGYSIPWVREQISAGRLPARAHQGAKRRSIRIHEADLASFEERWLISAEEQSLSS